jgi:hypothetical protein
MMSQAVAKHWSRGIVGRLTGIVASSKGAGGAKRRRPLYLIYIKQFRRFGRKC